MTKVGIKAIFVWVLAAFLLFSLAVGCAKSGAGSATEAEWSITIKDAEGGSVEFTNADAGKIDMIEVDSFIADLLKVVDPLDTLILIDIYTTDNDHGTRRDVFL